MPYSFLEHTADVRMSVKGKTREELFRDALLGMMKLACPRISNDSLAIKRMITLEASDATALLIDFLNETLSWSHAQREAYTAVKFSLLSENSLQAELFGSRADSFGEDIKAATYHEAEVNKDRAGEWSTTVIFDI